MRWSTIPCITMAICLAAAAVEVVPGLATAVELRPSRMETSPVGLAGVMTAHLAHWSWSHLGWDVAVFAAAGSLCERWMGRLRHGLLLAALAAATGWAVALGTSLDAYRGLSGIDCGLVVAAAVWWAMKGDRGIDRRTDPARWLPAVVVVAGLAVKCALEMASGASVFAGGAFVPVPLAHLAGAAAGLGFVLADRAAAALGHVCPSEGTARPNGGSAMPSGETAMPNAAALSGGRLSYRQGR